MAFKLTYFNGRGLAEQTRVLFAIAGESFEDVRFNFDPTTYACPDFDAAKASGAVTIGMERLPVLSHGDFVLAQSKSIERYVAARLGFLGSSDQEAALIDMITEHVRDIKQKFNDAKLNKKGDELAAARATFIADVLPGWYAKLERTLAGGRFAVGGKISLADVAIHNLTADTFFDDREAAAAALAAHPSLSAITANVAEAASAWISSRPTTAF